MTNSVGDAPIGNGKVELAIFGRRRPACLTSSARSSLGRLCLASGGSCHMYSLP